MTKKSTQVSMDGELFGASDMAVAKRLNGKRLDRIYQEGYRKVPETPEVGEAQVTIAGRVLSSSESDW
jgi:hypothetical protein